MAGGLGGLSAALDAVRGTALEGLGLAREAIASMGEGRPPGGVLVPDSEISTGFLERHASYLEFQPGENLDGNRGHTFVAPLKPLPTLGEQLESAIMAYGERPRTKDKIPGKFRRHGETDALLAIKNLEQQQRVSSARRGAITLYQAVSV